jgi:sensitive to high expression protein 9
MRPLLQHASRSFTAKVAFVASSPSRPVGAISRVSPLLCLRCPYRTASTLLRSTDRAPSHPQIPGTWSRRQFSSAAKWFEEGKPPNSSRSVPIPPLASEQKPVDGGQVKDNAREIESSLESQGLPQDDLNTWLERNNDAPRMQEGAVAVPQQPSTLHKDPKTTANKDNVADNITRVPDEHLPSHRERQRWDLSKRFSEAMDELLPKLAVVTQKVNTYTGTDYSGVEALRREIKEQGSCCPALHIPAMANNDQRILSEPVEPPLTPRSKPWIPHTPSKHLHKKRLSRCSSGNIHGRLEISNDTCLSFAPNT